MKKLLLLIMVAFAAIACEGPTGPEGPMGPPGSGAIQKTFVKDYTIQTTDWVKEITEEGFVYYTCTVKVNQLDDEYYYDGTVTGYIYFNYDTSNESKTLLPYTESYIDKEGFSYFENYTFEYSPGVVTFILKTNSPTPLPPVNCTFQVAMIY